MKRYKYKISNLDCANCARKLEDNLNKENILKNVIVNFSTSKISFDSDKEYSIEEINKMAKKYESECVITYTNNTVKQTKEYHVSIWIIGVLLGIVGMHLPINNVVNNILIILSYIFLLYKPFITAINMFVKNNTINENLLITISCVGAYFLGETMEGIMVVALYVLGKILEEKAVNNTRREVSNILDIKQDYANRKDGSDTTKIDVEEIKLNDILIIKKGEKVPVDGIIVKGNTLLDTSAITGESDLSEVNVGDNILSGTINTGNVIELKVTSIFEDSTVSKILELVEDATDKKAKTETFVSRASRVYTPIVLGLAIIVFLLLPILPGITFRDSLYRALTFLVISCPCAIAISVPLSYFTGIGVSSKNGILIKGSNYLDNLSYISKIIFDKTGTITTGSMEVSDIKILDNKYTKDEVIEILRLGESNSNHPIAKSIMKLSNKKINSNNIKNYKEISGSGITFELGKDKIKIGNSKLCNCEIDADVHLSINNKHVASILINDGIKDNAIDNIKLLKDMNIKTYMFTGDKKNVADEIGKKVGIDYVCSEMLPTDKYNKYENMSKDGDFVAFVGDGINDAPVLKRATIGISMGSIGSNQAIEASDIVIMNDDLSKIPLAINISKYTNYIIKQDLIFAISVKLIILLLSIFGLTTMWFAVFADTGVTVINILNTLRIMRKYK